MAFDIKDLRYEQQQRMLRGTSRVVGGDPYQLRIYVPDGFDAKRVEWMDGHSATTKTDENLLTVDLQWSSSNDVAWGGVLLTIVGFHGAGQSRAVRLPVEFGQKPKKAHRQSRFEES
jgi:hypothetical protein